MLLITNSALRNDNVRCEDHIHVSSTKLMIAFLQIPHEYTPRNASSSYSVFTHHRTPRKQIKSPPILAHCHSPQHYLTQRFTKLIYIAPLIPTSARRPSYPFFGTTTRAACSHSSVFIVSQIRICGDRDNLRTKLLPPRMYDQFSPRICMILRQEGNGVCVSLCS